MVCAAYAAAGGISETPRPAAFPDSADTQNAEPAPEPPAAGEGEPGEKETLAFAKAYPGRIAERAFRNGEWSLRIEQSWYAWANGRMMPEAEKNRWDSFIGLRFYRYPAGLPPLPQLDDEAKARLRQRLAADSQRPPERNEAFLSHLLEAATREAAEKQLVRVSIQGFPFRIHRLAAESLRRVDEELTILAQKDAEVRLFFQSIRHIGSFVFRPIAGTSSRSYHSYGLALDFIAKSWEKKTYYWRNIMRSDENWFELPYGKRWMVPLPVVEAFEKHGFIWGGKWLYFDTVHFEYRPELLILNADR
jgi:hypothetical protein